MTNRALRQAPLALASQGAYALSNLGLTIFAAVVLDAGDFGLFSMAVIGFLVLRGPIVAGIGHGAIIESSTPGDATISRCAVAGLRFGAIFGAIGLVVALATTSLWLAVVSVGLPLMLSFEVLRVVALGVGRAGLAARGDIAWLVAQAAAGIAAWSIVGSWSLTLVALLWIVGGVTALAAVAPSLRSSLREAHASVRLNRTLAFDDLVANGLQRGAMAAGALVVSAAAVGQTRLAIVPFNIVAVAFESLRPMLLAQLRSAADRAGRVLRLWTTYLSLAIIMTALNLVGLLIGLALFEADLGDNLAAAAEVIWWIALLRLSSAVSLVFSSTVQAHPRSSTRSVLLPRVLQGALTMALVLSFGASVGWTGIAIGLSLGSLGGTVLWCVEAIRIVRGPNGDSSAHPHVGDGAAEAARLA